MILNRYNKKNNVLYIVKRGEISAKEIIANLKKLGTDYCFLKNLYILEDTRNAKTSFSNKDHISFIHESVALLSVFNAVFIATVTHKSYKTILDLPCELNKHGLKNYCFSSFNTIEDAENWLEHKVRQIEVSR